MKARTHSIRHLALALLATALCGCRSHKEIAVQTSADIDSCATTSAELYIFKADSALRELRLDFDTLDITVERHVADAPETFRLRAIKGRVIDNRRAVNNAVAGYNRLDTVAFKQSSASSRAEHSATTSIAEPPNTTWILIAYGCVILIVIGVFVYLRRRQ